MRTFVLVVVFVQVATSEKYITKYDNLDLDEIINNERLLKNYVDCVMERGNYSPDGLELKNNIPDALVTDCSKCSEMQEDGTRRILKHLVKNKREWFDDIAGKYDPEGVFRSKKREEYAKEGIDF